MYTPRPYLSYSQMSTFEMNPRKFLELYFYENKQRVSRNMVYGSKLAYGLENEESTGDVLLDLAMARLPKFALMDEVVEDKRGIEVIDPHSGQKHTVPCVKNGKENIPILAKPDTAKGDLSAFKEYKTSTVKWNQQKADQSGQITFYATAIWLATGKIPEDIELVNVQTEYQPDGNMTVTGEIWRFKTTRSLTDVIRMQSRIKRAWSSIKTLCANEML